MDNSEKLSLFRKRTYKNEGLSDRTAKLKLTSNKLSLNKEIISSFNDKYVALGSDFYCVTRDFCPTILPVLCSPTPCPPKGTSNDYCRNSCCPDDTCMTCPITA